MPADAKTQVPIPAVFTLKEYGDRFDVSWKDLQDAHRMDDPGDELKRAVRDIRKAHGLPVRELPKRSTTSSVLDVLKTVYKADIVQRMNQLDVLFAKLAK